MGIFNYESKFMQLMLLVADYMILNFVYIICCLPVVTIGAAQAGLYAGMKALLNKEDDTPALRQFFIQCGKDNRWISGKSLLEHYHQTDLDISPATPEQLDTIIAMSKEKLLRPLSAESLLKLSNLSARQLIWHGEMVKRKRGEECS